MCPTVPSCPRAQLVLEEQDLETRSSRGDRGGQPCCAAPHDDQVHDLGTGGHQLAASGRPSSRAAFRHRSRSRVRAQRQRCEVVERPRRCVALHGSPGATRQLRRRPSDARAAGGRARCSRPSTTMPGPRSTSSPRPARSTPWRDLMRRMIAELPENKAPYGRVVVSRGRERPDQLDGTGAHRRLRGGGAATRRADRDRRRRHGRLRLRRPRRGRGVRRQAHRGAARRGVRDRGLPTAKI